MFVTTQLPLGYRQTSNHLSWRHAVLVLRHALTLALQLPGWLDQVGTSASDAADHLQRDPKSTDVMNLL
jgi:hypothetical protein